MAEQEAADLDAGRVRLADLDNDDYDYGGRKKKGKRKGKGKGGKKNTIEDEDECKEEIADPDDTNAMDQDVIIEDENGDIQGDDEMKVETDALSSVENDAKNEEINADAANVDDDLSNGLNNLDVSRSEESSEESEEEPDSWRCECCRKDFKSLKQFENHERSKKHKETLKKYEKKLKKEAALRDMIDEIDDEE